MPDGIDLGKLTPAELDLYRRELLLKAKSMRPETTQATFGRLGSLVPPPAPAPPVQKPEGMGDWQWWAGLPLRGLEQTFGMIGATATYPFRKPPSEWLKGPFGPAGYEEYQRWKGGPTEPYLPLGIPSWQQWGEWLGRAPEEPGYQMARMGMGEIAELAPLAFTGGIGAPGILPKAGEVLAPRAGLFGLKAPPPQAIRPQQLLRQIETREVAARRAAEEIPIKVEVPQGTIQMTTRQVTQAPSKTKVEIAKAVDDEFFKPIWDSPLDASATKYLETGNFKEYIRLMPEIKGLEALTVEEARAVGIALRATRAGTLVPALRRSGFYASEEFTKGTFREVSQVSGTWMDPTRMMQTIDSGFFGGMAQKYVLWPTKRTVLAGLNFSDSYKYLYRDILEKFGIAGRGEYRQKVGDVLQHISRDEVGATAATLLKKHDIIKFLRRYNPELQQKIVNAAKETRRFYDDMLDMQNAARGKRGQEVIAYKDNYRPWVIESNIWSRTFGLRQKPAGVMQSPMLPDYIKPIAPFNPRAQARMGGLYGYEKERDILKLTNDYIDTASKDIFNTNIIHNAKIHSATLRSMGFPNSAALIENWAAEAYAGIPPAIAKGLRAIIPNPVLRGMLWVRRRLTAAVFPGNWPWNVFVQTSSGTLTIMRYGVRNTLRGLDYLFTGSGRNWTRNNAYSWIIKKRMGGSVTYQDIGAGVEKVMKLEARPLEKVEHYANYLTHSIEEKLTGISIRAAYHDGMKKGFSGRALMEYASEGGAKTQSMYNLADLPGMLRAKEVGAVAPFQTFSFEVFNNVRELNIIGIRRIIGQAGAYETTSATSALGKATIQKRAKMLLEWFAALTAVNVVVDKAINRRPWNTSSFIPFFAVLTGGVNAGNPWNQMLPLKYSQEVKSGIDAVLRYGNWDKLRQWVIRYHMIGGVQIDRMLRGLEAVIEGRVTGVAGQTLFEVSPDEAIAAILMGPYQTEEGKEYIDKMQQAKGPLSEYTGIPMPRLEKTPKQQIEDATWGQYPASLKKIADQIKELEKTDPVAARKLQFQYPQILAIRRQIALQQGQLKRQEAIRERQELLKGR